VELEKIRMQDCQLMPANRLWVAELVHARLADRPAHSGFSARCSESPTSGWPRCLRDVDFGGENPRAASELEKLPRLASRIGHGFHVAANTLRFS